MPRSRFLDAGSLIVATVTLSLFVAALFTKGLKHDLFLEAGVFLVSVKIILMAYRNAVATEDLSLKLDKVLAALATPDKAKVDPGDPNAATGENKNQGAGEQEGLFQVARQNPTRIFVAGGGNDLNPSNPSAPPGRSSINCPRN